MTDDAAAGVALAMALALVSALSWTTAWLTRHRILQPNSMVGVRTTATRRSVHAWFAGHDAARPFLQAAGVVGLVGAGTVAVVAAVQGRTHSPGPAWWLGLACLGAVVLLLLTGTVAGHRAAQDSPPHED